MEMIAQIFLAGMKVGVYIILPVVLGILICRLIIKHIR